MSSCIFCTIPNNDIILENSSCISILNKYSFSDEEILVAPKKHKKSFFELSFQECNDINEMLFSAQRYLDKIYSPSDYIIGFASGYEDGVFKDHCYWYISPC